MQATRALLLPLLPLLLCAVLLPQGARTQDGEQRGLAVGSNQGAKAGPSFYALVIGNNAYQKVSNLRTAENDAKVVEATLREQYGFRTKLLLNATRQQIIAALNSYRRELDADSNLLIYYAGHGVNDKEIERAYWLPVDAEPDDNSNWISADDITSNIRGIPARHVLIVSDSCYSGTLSRGLEVVSSVPALRERYLQKMSAGRSRTLMASGGNEPVADDGGVGNHSVFASALVRGLQQTEKTQFTAAELYREYVEEPVAGRASQTPQYNPLRNSGHESGDFVFVRIKTPDGKTVEVTVSTGTAGAPDPAAVELSFWDSIKGSADPEDFKAYLQQYPAGQFAALAKNRINKLEAAAKTTATPAAPSEAASPSTEVAFWESVKGSTNAEDFRAYLKKFPNGTFAELANNRLKLLEKDEDTKHAADEIAKRIKSFRGAYGIRATLGEWYAAGELFVSPGKLEFRLTEKIPAPLDGYFNQVTSEGTETTDPLNCSQFEKAVVNKNFIREITCKKNYQCRFKAESDADAASALAAIREACNLPR